MNRRVFAAVAAGLRPAAWALAGVAAVCFLFPDSPWGGELENDWTAAVRLAGDFPTGRALTVVGPVEEPGGDRWRVGFAPAEAVFTRYRTIGMCVGVRWRRAVSVGPVALALLAAAWGAVAAAGRAVLPAPAEPPGPWRRGATAAVRTAAWGGGLIGAVLLGLGVPTAVGGWEADARAMWSAGYRPTGGDDPPWRYDEDGPECRVLSVQIFDAARGVPADALAADDILTVSGFAGVRVLRSGFAFVPEGEVVDGDTVQLDATLLAALIAAAAAAAGLRAGRRGNRYARVARPGPARTPR